MDKFLQPFFTTLHIGLLETKGERGVLNIHASDMLRLRYNPFYSNMLKQITDFLSALPVNAKQKNSPQN